MQQKQCQGLFFEEQQTTIENPTEQVIQYTVS